MFRRHRGILTVLVLAAMFLVTSPLGYAATDKANTITGIGNGYSISPVRSDPLTNPALTIKPGTSTTVRVYITNVSASPATLKVLMNDFRSDNENGAPALYLNGETAPRNSLKQYMSAPVKTITLAAGERKAVDVTIAIPADAKAGGYFGAVRFAPANTPDSDKVNVNLAASVASLILVTVPGNYKEQITIASFDARLEGQAHRIFTTSKVTRDVKTKTATGTTTTQETHYITGTVRFNNSGDVQEQPFGKITLKKGSKILDTYEINNVTPRGNILPDSIRRFSVDLKNAHSFGKYTLEGNFGYGNKGQLLTAQASFWVIPLAIIIAGVLAVVALLFLILGLPRLIRRYNRRVIRQSRGRR